MPTAMVVDDDGEIRTLFQTALQRAGFTTLSAASTGAAIHMLETNTPDIAFIDMNMPEQPGTMLLQHIRNTPRLATMKTVVVTANTHSDSRASELGADLFLVKPVPIQEMIRLACRIIGLPDTQ